MARGKNEFHKPVLLQEVIEGLSVKPGKKYIDATLGGGGHAIEILKRGGKVLGIDVDQEAINYVESRIKNQESRIKIRKELILVRGNFRDLGEIARNNGFGEVSGILFDLGVSSYQLTTAERGFSFQEEGTLDMRMDKTLSVKASDLVNGLHKNELIYLFDRFGQEKLARKLADAICRARKVERIDTTFKLAGITEEVFYGRRSGISVKARATANKRVFQALRIVVNDELGNLEKALPQAVGLLEEEGRLVVVSFHSLEDRIVKIFLREKGIKTKPIVPTKEEIVQNPRSRSAKLRMYIRKIGDVWKN